MRQQRRSHLYFLLYRVIGLWSVSRAHLTRLAKAWIRKQRVQHPHTALVERDLPNYIPKLARIAARSGRGLTRQPRPSHARTGTGPAPVRLNIEYLAGLVPVLRRRLAIAASFSDSAILASLTSIAVRSSYEARWQAAEASTLGLYLLGRDRDLKGSVTTILGLLPRLYL